MVNGVYLSHRDTWIAADEIVRVEFCTLDGDSEFAQIFLNTSAPETDRGYILAYHEDIATLRRFLDAQKGGG